MARYDVDAHFYRAESEANVADWPSRIPQDPTMQPRLDNLGIVEVEPELPKWSTDIWTLPSRENGELELKRFDGACGAEDDAAVLRGRLQLIDGRPPHFGRSVKGQCEHPLPHNGREGRA